MGNLRNHRGVATRVPVGRGERSTRPQGLARRARRPPVTPRVALFGGRKSALDSAPPEVSMSLMLPRAAALAAALALVASSSRANGVPTPSEFLKMPIGADRTLADYRQIASYFKALDAASPRVSMEVLGKSTLGEDIVMAVISSEANLRNLPRLK